MTTRLLPLLQEPLHRPIPVNFIIGICEGREAWVFIYVVKIYHLQEKWWAGGSGLEDLLESLETNAWDKKNQYRW